MRFVQVEEDKIQKIIEDLSGKDIEGINDMITAYVCVCVLCVCVCV